MNILVAGGAGFIGSNFVRYWAKAHPEDAIVVYDALTYAGSLTSLEGVPGSFHFVKGDIGNSDLAYEVMRAYEIDAVVNFAAESHNSLAILDPVRFFGTNVAGTVGLLEAARRVKLERFHHVSTCEVYGDMDLDIKRGFHEESPYLPRTPYNASKAGSDHAVRSYHLTYGVPISITNCANNYGPYQFPEKVIPLFTTNALDGKKLPIYASTQNRREWIHAVDHARAIDLVLHKGAVGRTYHVGTGVEKSIMEIADLVIANLGLDDSIKDIVPDRPSHDRRYLLDSTRIRTELGWEPTIPFDEGIKETIAFYVENRDWWEPLKKRAPVVEGGDWK